jgi:transcriptional regulator with XRE-family HTH domain
MVATARYKPVHTYSVGPRLTALLERRGIRPGVVADLVGVERSTLAKWAADERPVPGRHLALLCEVLQCRPDELLGEPVVGSLRQVSTPRCPTCSQVLP